MATSKRATEPSFPTILPPESSLPIRRTKGIQSRRMEPADLAKPAYPTRATIMPTILSPAPFGQQERLSLATRPARPPTEEVRVADLQEPSSIRPGCATARRARQSPACGSIGQSFANLNEWSFPHLRTWLPSVSLLLLLVEDPKAVLVEREMRAHRAVSLED